LLLGSAVHTGIGVWIDTGDQEYAMDRCKAEFCGNETAHSVVAETLVGAYIAHWGKPPQNTFSEQLVALRLSEEWIYRGKVDSVRLLPGGNSAILGELKTAGRVFANYTERLWSDMQITGYSAALTFGGIECRDVVYDIIRKPGIKPRRNEALSDYRARLGALYYSNPDEYFYRIRLRFFAQDHTRWLGWIANKVALIDRCHRKNTWPQSPSNCMQWNRTCAYWNLCQSSDSKIIIDTEYEHKKAHSELEPEGGV
jgi:hypothetical protein